MRFRTIKTDTNEVVIDTDIAEDVMAHFAETLTYHKVYKSPTFYKMTCETDYSNGHHTFKFYGKGIRYEFEDMPF